MVSNSTVHFIISLTFLITDFTTTKQPLPRAFCHNINIDSNVGRGTWTRQGKELGKERKGNRAKMRRSPRCVTRNVSVSFFFFVFIYLTFTIFLATIIVLEGIGTRYRDQIYCYTRWTPHVRMHMPHLDVTGQVATSPCQHLSSTDKAAGCGTFLVVVFSFFRTFFYFIFFLFILLTSVYN